MEKTREVEKKEQLADLLSSISKEYKGKYQGENLKILGAYIEALKTATEAEVIRNGASSLLISLRIAFQGIEKEKCKGGIIGWTLNSISKGVIDLIEKAYLRNEDSGSKYYFQLLIQALTIATISISHYLTQPDIAYNDKSDLSIEGLKAKNFGLELMFLMLINTQIVEFFVKDMARACGINEQQVGIITKLISGLILILAVVSAAGGDKTILKSLVFDLKDYLARSLEDVEAFINKLNESEIIDEKISSITIYIQQGLSSLQNEDFEILERAYAGALMGIESSPEKLEEDIEAVKQFSGIIYNAFVQSPFTTSRTTTSLMI